MRRHLVNQVTDYERLALCMIKFHVREGIDGEVAGVANTVSGRKESDREKESLHGSDVCFVAEEAGCAFTEHCITEPEYHKDFKVRGPRTCTELA